VKAAADVARYQDLVPKGAAAAQDLDRSIGELGEADAGIRAAEAQLEQAKLDLEYSTIRAPMDGIIGRAMVSVGDLIGAGGTEQQLTTIVTVDPIHVYFDVDQRTLQRYRSQAVQHLAGGPQPKTIRDLNIQFRFALAGEEEFSHEGVLDFIDNRVDPSTGTIAVRGAVANADGMLKPGFFARVSVSASPHYAAILVSEQAIGTQQGQKYVLVVDDANKVDFRPVRLGPLQSDGLRVIRAGLNPEERVVINGIQRARPGLPVTPEPGEMTTLGIAPQARRPASRGH
jgi:RND family efflux transporter MFP subunit